MKLLLISHFFPPMGGAGVQRALKFVRYLGDFGVQPVVLAGDDPGYLQDPSLLDEVAPGLRVLRVRHRTLLDRLRQRLPAGDRASGAGGVASSLSRSSTSRMRDAALGAWAALQWPDERGGWARAAWPAARTLVQDEGIEMVFSTAPPIAAHVLARKLARASGLPWVADYRDLWADNPGNHAPAWRRALERRAEARWLRDAAGVVAVTPSWQRHFAALLGERCPVAWIPNGYDEADFSALPSPRVPADGAFRLVHVGSLYGPRDPAPLLEGLERCLGRRPAGSRPLRLRLVGAIGSRFDAALAIFEMRHPGVIERRPYVAHIDALAEMRAADVLLLMVGAGGGSQPAVVAGTLPGKLFEYLRSRRPVLLLGDPQGDAAALLRQHGHGWIADELRPAAIADALQRMLAESPPLSSPDVDVGRYERRALTAELARFLDACRARWKARRG